MRLRVAVSRKSYKLSKHVEISGAIGAMEKILEFLAIFNGENT